MQLNTINTTGTASYTKRKSIAFKAIEANAKDAMAVYIRRQFDCAFIDATAIAAIEVAESLGFTDMAEEMRNDFYANTGREVLNGN